MNNFVDPLSRYDLFVSSTTTLDCIKSELERYLEEHVFPSTSEFDILAWWKSNGIKYLIMKAIARDVLATSVIIVASESFF